MESSLASSPLIITDDLFNAFHFIDRNLFARLILVLGRDPNESIHVMGFWLWLEQDHMKDLTIIERILNVDLPSLDQMADETVFCMTLIENDTIHPDLVSCDLRYLQQVLKKPLYLPLLHANRITVLRGVSRVISEVCTRAFRDILRYAAKNPIRNVLPYFGEQSVPSHQVFMGEPVVDPVGHMGPMGMGEHVVDPMGHMGPMGPGALVAPTPMETLQSHIDAINHVLRSRPVIVESHELQPQFYAQKGLYPAPALQGPGFEGHQAMQMSGGHMAQGFAEEQRRHVGTELSEMFANNLRFGNYEEEAEDVTADKRTIFLTFSRGYPISENEVREFFNRRFGDIIEAIHMQEVQGDDQVLYARVVAKSRAMVDRVVEGGRAKYYINGKHVCARKYVRNNQRSPPRAGGAGPSGSF